LQANIEINCMFFRVLTDRYICAQAAAPSESCKGRAKPQSGPGLACAEADQRPCTTPRTCESFVWPSWQAAPTRRAALLGVLTALAACTTTPPVQTPPSPPTPLAPPARRPRLGLALGGGAAKGFAHIGVIQVLEEAGIVPDLVVGTSAGSLVAALYASGQQAAQLQRMAQSLDEAALADWSVPFAGRGLLLGEALARYVNTQVRARLIEDMPLPLGIVATDLGTGEAVLFRRGDTGTAVRASSAVPAVFEPVRIAGRDYVDGGLVSPVPVLQARQMGADLVIAVDISSAPQGNPPSDTIRLLLQTFAIMGHTINTWALKSADVVVRPALQGLRSTDFSTRNLALEAGRQAMRAALPGLRERLVPR